MRASEDGGEGLAGDSALPGVKGAERHGERDDDSRPFFEAFLLLSRRLDTMEVLRRSGC